MHKAIGGYFESEKLASVRTELPACYILTKSGRASLRRILDVVRPSRVYVPYYTCDALLEPMEDFGIAYSFYAVNEFLEIENLPFLQRGDVLIYINYFGLRDSYSRKLGNELAERLILDNSQAFFFRSDEKDRFFAWNSLRKYFGVPDGSFLFVPENLRGLFHERKYSANDNYTTRHLQLRSSGHVGRGYSYFLQNEELAGKGMERMSSFTEEVIRGVDFASCSQRRKENYAWLHRQLGDRNLFPAKALEVEENSVPFAYPYWAQRKIHHEVFWKERIFVPVFWKECLDRVGKGYELEKRVAADLLALPIDHRYTIEDMRFLAAFVSDNEDVSPSL